MQVWIVGRFVRELSPEEMSWVFMGAFDSEELAAAACTTPNDFVGPTTVNERLLDGVNEGWPGIRYPLAPIA